MVITDILSNDNIGINTGKHICFYIALSFNFIIFMEKTMYPLNQ